ncbi:MAG: SCP2 sterol-binding domain-containing protein [Gammaproteobacteria bacterium]|jgi:ubiquinone biosynthesis accessory factor UbiJ
MEAGSAALLGIEQALNGLLTLDPIRRERLAKLHGKRIALELGDWNLTLVFVPDANGELQLFNGNREDADGWIRSTPLDLIETAMQERKEDQVFRGKVELGGDTRLAQAFSTILSDLDPDWEELLSGIAGDAAAHQTGNAIRSMIAWGKRNTRILQEDLGEYLTEERRLLPTRFEFEEWRDSNERLRDDVERLEARINQLAGKRE